MQAAIIVTMTTPRIELGTIHVNGGDVLGGVASVCWLASWVLSRSKAMMLRAALWPSLILALAVTSTLVSLDVRAAGVGVAELAVLWVLPAVTIPNILSSSRTVPQFVTCISIGSLIAGAANLIRAVELGVGSGGLPQVWCAAQYFQGYFQAIGLA